MFPIFDKPKYFSRKIDLISFREKIRFALVETSDQVFQKNTFGFIVSIKKACSSCKREV